jgi:hypothetical protein
MYLGELRHKQRWYKGEHEALIAPELFAEVDAMLASHRVARQQDKNAAMPSLLAGMIEDAFGRAMTPNHAVKHALRYRYYVSRAEYMAKETSPPVWRIPAGELESLVVHQIKMWLKDRSHLLDWYTENVGKNASSASDVTHLFEAAIKTHDALDLTTPTACRAQLLGLVDRISVGESDISIALKLSALRANAASPAQNDTQTSETKYLLKVPAKLVRTGRQVRLAFRRKRKQSPPVMIRR